MAIELPQDIEVLLEVRCKDLSDRIQHDTGGGGEAVAPGFVINGPGEIRLFSTLFSVL